MVELNSFEKTSKADWVTKIANDLKGKPIESLDWHINDTLIVKPFSSPSDISSNTGTNRRLTTNEWVSIEPIWVDEDYYHHNGLIMEALNGGISGLLIHLSKEIDQIDIAQLLDKVHLQMIHINWTFDKAIDVTHQWSVIINYLRSKDLRLENLSISLNAENIEIDETLLNSAPNTQMLGIDGVKYYNGRDKVDAELGHIIFETQQLIERFDETALRNVISHLHFTKAIDDCYLLNIAAIRALRKCLSLLFSSYNIQLSSDSKICAIIPEQVMVDDINYNRIKCTSAALSGVIGGADQLQIYNRSLSSSEPEKYRRKIARNINHLMSMESYIDRVVDPAQGSYYIESLTEKIAESSWQYFKNIWSNHK